MRHRLLLVVVLVSLVLAACGGGETTATTEPEVVNTETTTTAIAVTTTTQAPSVPQGCDVLHQPGEYERLGRYEDVDQPYWMVVPSSYADVAPAPLYLHLASGNGDHDLFMAAWRPYLDDLDGLMAMVNTAISSRGESDALASLIDQMSAEFCVDAQRVHVLGGSHSFRMAERLACEYSEKIASFSAIAGSPLFDCSPDNPVPLLTVTGDGDRPGVERLVERWVAINECDPEPVIEDLGSGVMKKMYQNCDAEILFFDIEGGRHAWPTHEAKGPAAEWFVEYEELDYLEEALGFFATHPLQ